jgi:glycosyltransferase involved in cell wall biosynthesis
MTIALEPYEPITASERRSTAIDWHILTGEYPPECGGVGHYTRLVACGLATAGDDVTVWTPSRTAHAPEDAGVTVRGLPDQFGWRSRRDLSRELDDAASPRVLVQYVPHAFGWKGGNLPFCLWLWNRKDRRPWVMFHEVAYPFEAGDRMGRRALAAVNRVMARLVSRAAHRAFVSIPAWRREVESLAAAGTSIVWLPVPATVPVVRDAAATAAVRRRYGADRPIVGCFGTFGSHLRAQLHACLPLLAKQATCSILLIGRHSEAMVSELASHHPELAGRLHGTGALTDEEISVHLHACDVMLQPFPDGVSTRRTTAMAGLAHDRAIVTTTGALTEAFWALDDAAILVPADDPARLASSVARLVTDPTRQAQLGARAADLYRRRFDVAHTVNTLRRTT